MNRNLPHRTAAINPWASHHEGNDNAGEGPSRTAGEAHRDATRDTNAQASDEHEMLDPPTPPEEAPEDDLEPFEHVEDNSPPGYGPTPRQSSPWPAGPPHHTRGPPLPWMPPHDHGHGHGHGHRRGQFANGGGPWAGRSGHGRGRGRGPGGRSRHGGFDRMPFPHFGPFWGAFSGPGGATQQPDWASIPKKLWEQFAENKPQDEDGVDFQPLVDVYDYAKAYVIHVSLPGAKKDDVAVTWDQGRSTLTIGGVVTRDVDEKSHEALALGERDIGLFRRLVRLGDSEHPASVDADSIEAKMAGGILELKVPKREWVPEPKKVVIR